MRDDFDKDPKQPNPYDEPRVRKLITVCFVWPMLTRPPDVTLSKLKRVLAAEEVAQLNEGQEPPHDITPSGFVRMAIDIEERQ